VIDDSTSIEIERDRRVLAISHTLDKENINFGDPGYSSCHLMDSGPVRPDRSLVFSFCTHQCRSDLVTPPHRFYIYNPNLWKYEISNESERRTSKIKRILEQKNI
jgi:hypothetical protein